jgi:hypothetical protein
MGERSEHNTDMPGSRHVQPPDYSAPACRPSFSDELIPYPFAVALFMVAGVAAGVVASSATQSRSSGADDFLREKIGPWNTALLPARLWVHVEHTAFRLGVICAVLSFVFSK